MVFQAIPFVEPFERSNIMDLIQTYMRRLTALDRAELTKRFYNRLLTATNHFLKDQYGVSLTVQEAEIIKGYMLDDIYKPL